MEVLFYILAALLVGFIFGRFLPRKHDGSLEVSKKDHTKIYKLGIDTDPDDLQKKARIILRVDLVEDQE